MFVLDVGCWLLVVVVVRCLLFSFGFWVLGFGCVCVCVHVRVHLRCVRVGESACVIASELVGECVCESAPEAAVEADHVHVCDKMMKMMK